MTLCHLPKTSLIVPSSPAFVNGNIKWLNTFWIRSLKTSILSLAINRSHVLTSLMISHYLDDKIGERIFGFLQCLECFFLILQFHILEDKFFALPSLMLDIWFTTCFTVGSSLNQLYWTFFSCFLAHSIKVMRPTKSNSSPWKLLLKIFVVLPAQWNVQLKEEFDPWTISDTNQ